MMDGRGKWAVLAGVVALVLAGVGIGYIADGLQEGGQGGEAVDPETGRRDPARDGEDGVGGSTFDVALGAGLLGLGLAFGFGGALIARSGRSLAA